MGLHNPTQVDTLGITHDYTHDIDDLIVAVYQAARVTLKEAEEIASGLLTLYASVNKTTDVVIDDHDLDPEVFEAALTALTELRATQ